MTKWELHVFEKEPVCRGCGVKHLAEEEGRAVATIVRRVHVLPNPNDPKPACGLARTHLHNRCRHCDYEWASKLHSA